VRPLCDSSGSSKEAAHHREPEDSALALMSWSLDSPVG